MDQFLSAGQAGASVKAILGPTNTGKTYFAIERMLAHPTGMIGLPLRLLAREVYGRVVARVGEQAVALVTGEERIVPANPRYWVATVEAMPTEMPVDCLVIDEIQTAIDLDRGHVFTNRILNARGRYETLLLGAGTMAPLIRALLPNAEIISRPRLSQLTYSGSKKISRQPERSAIVTFSATEVYAIAELLRRERGGAAVVMGALSPRTRNAQVELYQSGEVDFLVATDAIGMGLNLDVHHIAFANDHKFDGKQTRPLTPAEMAQIAGRAGRHTRNGTFGVTGGVEPFEEDLVTQLEGHDFTPVKVIQWRNPELDFSSLEALRKSLDRPPAHKGLTRVPVATDQQALEFVARHEAAGLAQGIDAIKTLWECCQIPDYRDISPTAHGEIVNRIFSDLMVKKSIDADWIAEQVRFCDNASGDIDTLSNRIRQIRTWTFVANRRNWLEDPTYWREKTRDIEDRLSDALHERLIQRFVDRRTGVLIRHLRDKRMVSPHINDRGEVSVEGHLIGTLEGFRFTLARSEEGDPKGLRAAASNAVAPEIRNRADRLAGAPNEEIVLATDGRLRWRGEIIAELAEGDTIFSPRIIVLADEALTGTDLERVQERLGLWLRHHINTQLEQVISLAEPTDLEGTARGIAYRLSENLGILPRSDVAEEVKGLDQDVRARMRKHGVKFGAYHIYLPQSLKPAPRELALILYALKNGGVRQPGVSDLPHIVLSGRTSFEVDPEVSPRLYEIAGFKVAGKRAVRADILERLADIIRPLIALDARHHQGELPAGAAEGNGFRVTVEMTSLLGCSGEDFASILNSLDYRVRRVPKPAAPAADDTSEAISAEITSAEAPVADASIADASATGTVEGASPTASSEAAEANADLGGAPVSEAAEPAQAPADIAADAEAQAVAEGASGPSDGETAPDIAQAAADLGSVPADVLSEALADAPAEDKPAEPEFDEIWFPGGRRPDNPRHQNGRRSNRQGEAGNDQNRVDRPRHDRGPRPDGQRSDGQRPDSQRTDGQRPDGQKPEGGRPGGKPRFDKKFDKRDDRSGAGNNKPRRERKEPAFDPDSPFAALAALRNRKSE